MFENIDESRYGLIIAKNITNSHLKLSGPHKWSTSVIHLEGKTEADIKNTGTQNLAQGKTFEGDIAWYNSLKSKFSLSVLSMGMTSDYKIALACGSNLVRVGSAIFGNRD